MCTQGELWWLEIDGKEDWLFIAVQAQIFDRVLSSGLLTAEDALEKLPRNNSLPLNIDAMLSFDRQQYEDLAFSASLHKRPCADFIQEDVEEFWISKVHQESADRGCAAMLAYLEAASNSNIAYYKAVHFAALVDVFRRVKDATSSFELRGPEKKVKKPPLSHSSLSLPD